MLPISFSTIVFRGTGNAAMAMRGLWLASLKYILLCRLFVHGFGQLEGMGLVGSAWATSIVCTLDVLYLTYHLFRKKHQLQLMRSDF